MKVWAPHASRVDIVAGERRVAMHPADGGWHVAATPLPPDTDYWLSLDEGELLADPRSPWQPGGVDGPSRTLDHAAFRWTDRSWRGVHLPAAVMYEIHVGTFSPAGTFDGATSRLGHLVELGIDIVEVMPVATFAGTRGWGYDGVALYAPHHAYGGPDALKRFVGAAHARGIGVFLDVVYNHLGPVGNRLSEFGPYFSAVHRTPWGAAFNLDGPDSGPVRRFLIDNALMWFEDYHVDGLRLDAVHALADDSAYHFVQELQDETDRLAAHLGRPLWLVAENDRNDPKLVTDRGAGGFGLAAQWSDDFHHALHVALTHEKDGYYADYDGLPDLAKALTDVFVLDGRYSPSRRQRHGRPVGPLDGHRFVVGTQNHDQVGNRAMGERLAHLVDPQLLTIAAALALLSPYVPLVFQGEEWGASSPFLYFADFDDADLADAVREGRRAEFAGFEWDAGLPDPMAEATAIGSTLDWDERQRHPHRTLLAWYRSLIALRRGRHDITDGDRDKTSATFDATAQWLALHRDRTTVAANFAAQTQAVPLVPGAWQVLLASARGTRLLTDGVVVPGHSVAIVGRLSPLDSG